MEKEQLIMDYIKYYCIFSLAIGFIYTVVIFVANRNLILSGGDRFKKEFLYKDIGKGSIQREIYSDRVAYHENDFEGELAIKSFERFDRAIKNRSIPYIISFAVFSTVYLGVIWPRDLYDFITSKDF